MATQILIAGFGGQGVLFAGKFLAYHNLLSDKNVSWLPSYGPEMRGGTANCSVILADEGEGIGSPIVTTPDLLIAMNLPSLDKYEDAVPAGGKIFFDSSLIGRTVKRTDVDAYSIPATKLASDNGMPTLANMILLGLVIRKTGIIPFDGIEKLVESLVPPARKNLIELNLKALSIGYSYQE